MTDMSSGGPPAYRGESGGPPWSGANGGGQAGGYRSTDYSQSSESGTGTQVKEQAGQVATVAKQGAKEVVGEVQSQAGHVLEDAAGEARDLMHEVKSELRQQASTQSQRAAGGLRTLAGQIEALRSGRPESAGPVLDYSQQIGDKVQALADRIEAGGVEGVVDDVRRFARRRPGAFLLGAVAAGFAVGRLARSGAAASHESASGQSGMSGQSSYGRQYAVGNSSSSGDGHFGSAQSGTSSPTSGSMLPPPGTSTYPSAGTTYPSGGTSSTGGGSTYPSGGSPYPSTGR